MTIKKNVNTTTVNEDRLTGNDVSEPDGVMNTQSDIEEQLGKLA